MTDDRASISDIILIGPIGAGKTTVAELLARWLYVPCVSLDTLAGDYFREIGFDREEQLGPDGMFASRFNVHAVRRMLEDHTDCVFDLGAGHSVYRDAESLDQVRQLLAPYPNVFLLLPSPDPDESSRLLALRNAENDWLIRFRAESGYDPNDHFLRHPSNYVLAKHTVYTEGSSPEETAAEILHLADTAG